MQSKENKYLQIRSFQRPALEHEVKELIDTPLELYKEAGMTHNPFYYFSKKRNTGDILQGESLQFMKKRSKSKPHIYLTGNLLGGSGKTYLLNQVFDDIATKKDCSIVLLKDIVRYRYPICVIEVLLNELEVFFNESGSSNTYCILDEVEFNEIYSFCFSQSQFIIGGGHYLYRDAGNITGKFEDINIDQKWKISSSQIHNHLKSLLLKTGGISYLNDAILKEIAVVSPTIGVAELISGLLLATKIRRLSSNIKKDIGKNELELWLQIIPTNWFWYSMDCWKVKNPARVTLLKSIRGIKFEYQLQIHYKTDKIERIEKY